MATRKRRRVHRRGRKSTARRKTRVAVSVNPRRRRRRSTTRRRRNWATSGLVVPANPRRRRRRSMNPRRRRTHHRRRSNPFRLSGMPPIKTVVFAGIGFAAPSFVSGFLTSNFPTIMQQTTSLGVAGKYIVKIGSILGLSWLTRKFVGPTEAQAVMVGGGANIAISLMNDFVPGILPANPLGMYLPNVMPTMLATSGSGVKAYIPNSLRGLRAVPRLPGAVAFPTTVAGGTSRGAYGGTAARFLRF
jgi:hypothetical protein